MSQIVNTAGQAITTESSTPAGPPQVQQPLTAQQMQQIIGAYARLKELSAATIANPRDEAEVKGLQNFLMGALMTNAEELFGAWVVCNQEYTPLIHGFTALLKRALTRIDAANKGVPQAVEVPTTPGN